MEHHFGFLRNMASVYLRQGEKLLLLYRQGNSIVNNMWIGSAGGHFEKDELNNAKACVLREMREELNLSPDSIRDLSLRYITLRYTDKEIRQNYYFFADLIGECEVSLPSTEGITQWYGLNELEDLQMPFTAKHVITHYLKTGQYNDFLYGGLANSNDVIFEKL